MASTTPVTDQAVTGDNSGEDFLQADPGVDSDGNPALWDLGSGTATNGEFGSGSNLNDVSSAAQKTATAQPVVDKAALDLLGKVAENTKKNAEIDKVNSDNATCIASMGRLIIKMLLQKLTVSTVNWIKGGFNGGPAFVQDPSKFFGDIAKNAVLQFGLEINNPQLFPFGQAWQRNTALAFKNKFQDNARYSLNELIQQTNPNCQDKNGNQVRCDVAFNQDFSQGGWNAWTAMTQVPANNPLGFKLMADNELQQRLADTVQSTAQYTHEALQAAQGFLGDYRCTDPLGVTKAQDDAALRGTPSKKLCNKWEYVTPGSMVAYAAQNVMGYQSTSYFNVQDLNDAVAAISDALLSQFSSTIMEKGFANTSGAGANGTLYTSSVVGSGVAFQTQTEKDFTPSQLTSSWLTANPDFDIRKDLTQALIDEQRTYSDKLALQNKELNSTTDGQPYKVDALTYTFPDGTTTKVSNAHGLMPAIYQLDYCIPGPHPGWESDSKTTLENVIIPSAGAQKTNTGDVVAESVVSAGLNFVPIVGSFLSSMFGGLFTDSAAKAASFNTRDHYAQEFEKLTGYHLRTRSDMITATDLVDVNMSSSDGLMQSLDTILNRYINIMDETYFSSPDYLPPIAKEAATDFYQLPGYTQMIKDNEDKIISLKTTVGILGQIKVAVDLLNTTYPKGGDTYESELKTQINAFGRVSADMVNGDDIANADSIYKQIVDKKDYIYKNLLKGPYGCETWLANSSDINFPPTPTSTSSTVDEPLNDWGKFSVNSVKRMTYPFPIIYDYNNLAAGAKIPDPWNSGYKSTDLPNMPAKNEYATYGPGFLSFVLFSNNTGAPNCGGNRRSWLGAERLRIDDLVDTNCSETAGSTHVPVGMSIQFNSISNTNTLINNNGIGSIVGGALKRPNIEPFESTIGIY
jgi:hypothetical protein